MIILAYGESKVYFDGSHYIAIPKTTNPAGKNKRKKPEKEIEIEEEIVISEENSPLQSNGELFESDNDNVTENTKEIIEEKPAKVVVKRKRKTTLKTLFDEAYKDSLNLSKKERFKAVCARLKPHFSSEKDCKEFVRENFARKLRNLICRRVRIFRKVNLQEFNYFCTFTYDNKLHTEKSFQKKLKTAFRHLTERRDWKYMGIWERSPENKRLHFHGIFHIPKDNIPGEFTTRRDYSFSMRRMREIKQNSYFLEKFGRNDFEPINTDNQKTSAMTYIIKYLEKTEEKIVASKGMYQYFVTDILEEDVVCRIGQEDKKLLLFDDFKCIDEGEILGSVCKEVIKQLPKAN